MRKGMLMPFNPKSDRHFHFLEGLWSEKHNQKAFTHNNLVCILIDYYESLPWTIQNATKVTIRKTFLVLSSVHQTLFLSTWHVFPIRSTDRIPVFVSLRGRCESLGGERLKCVRASFSTLFSCQPAHSYMTAYNFVMLTFCLKPSADVDVRLNILLVL